MSRPLATPLDVTGTGDRLVVASSARPGEDEAGRMRRVGAEAVQEALELRDAAGDPGVVLGVGGRPPPPVCHAEDRSSAGALLAAVMLLGGISLVRAAPLAAPAVLEITEFPVPRGSGPHDVAPAIDGGVWYTAQRSGELGWLNPATGETRHVALGRAGERSAPHGVVGPDGAPWITDFGANALVRFDPSSESFEVLPHAAPGANVRQLLGRPGEVWGLPRARTAWSSSTPASYRASVISRPVRADS